MRVKTAALQANQVTKGGIWNIDYRPVDWLSDLLFYSLCRGDGGDRSI